MVARTGNDSSSSIYCESSSVVSLQSIIHFQLPIAKWQQTRQALPIGNWQLEIGNVLDGRPTPAAPCA
jgi:hypothetical protein